MRKKTIFVLGLVMVLLSACKSSINYESVTLPRSTYHHTNGTWWGYNQVKLVRHGEMVYTYYINNENLEDGEPNKNNPSEIVMLRIDENLNVDHFDSHYSSRTAALSIDSKGRLLVCVFEPTSSEDNGSFGRLVLYTYTFKEDGSYQRHEEVVVKNDGSQETANMRFSMAIDDEDNLVVGFGINYWENEALNHTMTAYVREASSMEWTSQRLAEHLGEDNYYPYMIINGMDDVRAFSVQDECYMEMTQFDYPCFYQYVRYYEDGRELKTVDYSDLEIAKERPQLMEQVGFHLDNEGDIHMMSRANIESGIKRWNATFDYYSGSIDKLVKEETDYISGFFNWLRFFEYDGKMYMVGAAYERAAIINVQTKETHWLDIDKDAIRGSYIYINSKRGGSDTDKYLDIYFVPANSDDYDHDGLYMRIDMEEIAGIK